MYVCVRGVRGRPMSHAEAVIVVVSLLVCAPMMPDDVVVRVRRPSNGLCACVRSRGRQMHTMSTRPHTHAYTHVLTHGVAHASACVINQPRGSPYFPEEGPGTNQIPLPASRHITRPAGSQAGLYVFVLGWVVRARKD